MASKSGNNHHVSREIGTQRHGIKRNIASAAWHGVNKSGGGVNT